MDDKYIGGEAASPGSDGYIAGGAQPGNKQAAPAEQPSLETELQQVTAAGGLSAVPPHFEDKDGYWKTILSANPFEALYLDYRQYAVITPETVKKNYDALTAFWMGKGKLLTGGAREKIKARYGEDTVTNAVKLLDAAYQKLKTKEGIDLYYREIDRKRYTEGLKSVEELVDISLEDGEFTKQEAARIISKAVKHGLTETEIRSYLLALIKDKGFKPRNTKQVTEEFEGQWMTDERWKTAQSRTTIWLDHSVSTLEETGEVTFNHKEKAFTRLSGANYLPVVVSQLTNNTDKGFEYEEIIRGENDREKRFLKVVYRLNPSLPFLLEEWPYPDIESLLADTATDYGLFTSAAASYKAGHLHIWLKETDPENAAKLTADTQHKNFLTFLYRVNKTHPFYLNGEKFDTPKQLAERAKYEAGLWNKIAEAMMNGQLPAWLEGIGRLEWIQQYNQKLEPVLNASYYQDEDKRLAAAQTFIEVIAAQTPQPVIASEPAALELTAIEGSKLFQHTFKVKLSDWGFTKAVVYLDKNIEGIWLNEKIISLHSLYGTTEKVVTVSVDALKLVKDKLYNVNIIIATPYQTVALPVKIKIVFPKKAFIAQLLKYAAFGALFFGIVRYLLGAVTGFNTWLAQDYHFYTYTSLATPSEYLPPKYFLFFVILLVLLGGLIASFSIIKKGEKL
ncbi:hypothetical protein [Foetidibacter luteolus]|uniref:hypothetical protein n=1 Tax=Foetidibacter luteolus TaxID=2608880 RepID=UPI00129A2D46|nr:hypothetical protein [Foetidibacter luteolus]